MRRETLDENIAQLQSMLGELGDEVLSAYRAATTALLDQRVRLAERVIDHDAELDRRRAEIEHLAVETISVHSPVTGAMRSAVAAIQSAHELERMGDLAQHIAEITRRRDPQPVVPEVARDLFERLAAAVGAMTAKSVEVLRTHNVILALELESDDDQVDALQRDLFALMFGPEWTCGIAAAVDTTLLARFFERFADHAVALAERTVFVVTGQHPEALQL